MDPIEAVRKRLQVLPLLLGIFTALIPAAPVVAERPAADAVEICDAMAEGSFQHGTLSAEEYRSLHVAPRSFPRVARIRTYGGADRTRSGADCSDLQLDVAILGDGFTASELEVFESAANEIRTGLLKHAPLDRYGASIRFHILDVVAPESGVSEAPTGLNPGVQRATLFNTTVGCAGTGRRVCTDDELVRSVAQAAVPSTSLALLVVNSNVYGGTGYYSTRVGTVTLDDHKADIAAHELLGHALATLTDEYEDDGVDPNYSGPEPTFVNVSTLNATEMLASKSKWFRWLGYHDPILGAVDTFAGGYYRYTGIFRSTVNSLMRSVGYPFSPVQKESIAIAIRGSTPLIRCVSSYFVEDRDQPLRVDLAPVGGEPLQVSWFVDGAPIPSAAGTTLDLRTLHLSREAHQLKVVVTDTGGGTVRDEAALSDYPFRQFQEFPVFRDTVRFTRPLGNQLVKKGRIVTFSVQAAYATSYEWFVNGKLVKNKHGATLRNKIRKDTLVQVIAHDGDETAGSYAFVTVARRGKRSR